MYKSICKQVLFIHSRCIVVQQRGFLKLPSHKRDTPELYDSLEERLKALDVKSKDPEFYKRVNIGLEYDQSQGEPPHSEKSEVLEKIKQDVAMEKASRKRTLFIDVEKAEAESEKSFRPSMVHSIAEHFHIFKDLFGDFAYFFPVIPMNIAYDYDDDSLSPVYMGNLLKPKETSCVPHVKIGSPNSDSLWTLILTNPDGNLYEENAEMLHWFVGNIKGNDLEKGEVIAPYLQPFPPWGTGFHRYIFLLYKQKGKIDFSQYKEAAATSEINLRNRTFNTTKFYKQYENELTPAGLNFFQADWDSSLREFFHKKLNMREPSFEYEFPKAYVKPQQFYPGFRAFNRYLDLHRDPKDISKDILLKRLSKIHPFEGDLKLLPYPHVVKVDTDLPIWQKNELHAEREGRGKFRELYKGDNRPSLYYGPFHAKITRPLYPFFNRRFKNTED